MVTYKTQLVAHHSVSYRETASERYDRMRSKSFKRSAEKSEDCDVKGKKVRTAPTNTSLLPPCKVCQEPAAGFHYGVNTCEACKGFFRRSLLRKEEYKCIGDGNCNIQAGKRKICSKCRHEKCLAAGMSKEAIKTGRYTHAKRTQDILEYKQMIGLPMDAAATTTITVTTTFSEPVLKSEPQPSTPSPALIAGSQLSVIPSSGASVSHTSQRSSSLSPSIGQTLELASPLSVGLMADSMLESFAEGQGRSDEVLSPWSIISASPSVSSSVSSPQSSKASPASLSKPASVTASSLKDDLDEEECQRIIQQLVEAHDQIILKFKFSPEEVLEKQKACAEACKLRMEMFGPLKSLSEEEYQDIYQQTGLDVDGRQTFVTNLCQMLEDKIRRYTAFVKAIPGFSQLSIKDQIRLIKDNRCEFSMMSMYPGYNHELQVVTMLSGRTFCIHEHERFSSRELALQRFETARAIDQLGLMHGEEVLLKSLIIVTVGHEDVDEPEKVSAIQWKLAQCLLWLLKKTRPNPNHMFARIVATFCTIRQLSAPFYEWIKSKPFEHYSQFKDNALLVEWFSNS